MNLGVFQTGDAEFREIWSELQLTFHKPFNEIKVSPSIIHGDFCTINIGQWQGQPGNGTYGKKLSSINGT